MLLNKLENDKEMNDSSTIRSISYRYEILLDIVEIYMSI